MVGLPYMDGCDMPFIQYTMFSLYFIPKKRLEFSCVCEHHLVSNLRSWTNLNH